MPVVNDPWLKVKRERQEKQMTTMIRAIVSLAKATAESGTNKKNPPYEIEGWISFTLNSRRILTSRRF